MFNEFASESSIVLPSNLPKLSPRKSCPSKFTTKSLHPTKTTTVVAENNHTSNKRPPSKHRKLPGPAGLLPKLHEQTNHKQRSSVKLKSPKRVLKLNKDNPLFDSPERCSLSTSLSESQSTSSQGEEAALLNRVQLECGSTV
ncbi:unnamed protein product, partial [Trichobilharzia regenti]